MWGRNILRPRIVRIKKLEDREDRSLPTINQLVRKGRSNKERRSKAPALLYSYNALKNRTSRLRGSPQKRGVCTWCAVHWIATACLSAAVVARSMGPSGPSQVRLPLEPGAVRSKVIRTDRKVAVSPCI